MFSLGKEARIVQQNKKKQNEKNYQLSEQDPNICYWVS